jgi:hypothetical protein
MPMGMRRRTARPSFGRRLRAHLAVVAGRVLATQPPARIRAVLAAASRGAPPASRRQAQEARDDVIAVSLVCRGANGCVPRSVASAVLCRLAGSWPTWRVGVRPVAPFAAHAWIEAEGIMIGEEEPAGYFRPLLTVAPAVQPAAPGTAGPGAPEPTGRPATGRSTRPATGPRAKPAAGRGMDGDRRAGIGRRPPAGTRPWVVTR